jgi:hypothetical protein
MYDLPLRYSEWLLANLTVLNMLKRRTCDRREDALPRNVVTPSKIVRHLMQLTNDDVEERVLMHCHAPVIGKVHQLNFESLVFATITAYANNHNEYIVS